MTIQAIMGTPLLRSAVGRGDGDWTLAIDAELSARLLAEEADLLWEARQAERWLGCYESADEDEDELDRVAVIGRLGGHWYTMSCLVNGEGRVQHAQQSHWHPGQIGAAQAYQMMT